MWKSEKNQEPKLSRREAFQIAAAELDATFVEGKRSSADEVQLQHGPWTVMLDTYVVSTGQVTVTYTRARAYYLARDDFTLRVFKRNAFSRIPELFGFYGLLVGDEEFERKYKVKCSNDPRGRSFMSDSRLRELIMVQPSLQLDIRKLSWSRRRKMGDGVRVVTVQTTGVIKEPDRLANYVRLITTALDLLARLGGAYPEEVDEDFKYVLA